MENCSYLEVDVNGQQIFWVNKVCFSDPISCFFLQSCFRLRKSYSPQFYLGGSLFEEILASFCSKISNLSAKNNTISRNMKVIFQDFPCGPFGFELVTQFCYNNDSISINPSNVILLNCVANYMEMSKKFLGFPNLIEKTEKLLEDIDVWTFSDLLLALKQGQNLLFHTSFPITPLQKLVDELVIRVCSTNASTPSDISSKCSSFRSSFDSKITESTKNTCNRSPWWFDDLAVFNIDLVEIIVRKMVSEKFDHITISKFLFHYQKIKLFECSRTEKTDIINRVINLFFLIDKRSISIKGLFETLRIASSSNLSKLSKMKIVSLIGAQLDQATLDDILVRSPRGKLVVYDVNLVLRCLKSFLHKKNDKILSSRLKKVARMIDLYAVEIAADRFLKPLKFAAIVLAVPDSARDSCDRIYQAIDIYFEVHRGLSEQEKTKICSALNYNKLSPEVLTQISQNSNLPLNLTAKSLICQQCEKELILKSKDIVRELARNEKIRFHKQKRAKIQTQLGNLVSAELCCSENVRYLPKLCS